MNRIRVFKSNDYDSADNMFNRWMLANEDKISLEDIKIVDANNIAIRYIADNDFEEQLYEIEPGVYLVNLIKNLCIKYHENIDVSYMIYNFQAFTKFKDKLGDEFLINFNGNEFYYTKTEWEASKLMSRANSSFETNHYISLCVDDIVMDEYNPTKKFYRNRTDIPEGEYKIIRIHDSYELFNIRNNGNYTRLVNMDKISDKIYHDGINLHSLDTLHLLYKDGNFKVIDK